jgi:transcriptional/translational regulatory protein YebC/TACO1
MSGHSKWSSIKHKKGAADAKRGKLFTKLARAITVAARDGGGSTDANHTLALAVQKARDASMPKDTIQRAIDREPGPVPMRPRSRASPMRATGPAARRSWSRP